MTGKEHDVPEFGDREARGYYVDRPGSYGLAFDDMHRVCLLRTPLGDFLPGGGADAGETPEETLTREVGEECGCTVQILRMVGVAIQNVDAGDEGFFAKRCVFYVVQLGAPNHGQAESDHVMVWLPIEQASRRLHEESQRWALATAAGALPKRP